MCKLVETVLDDISTFMKGNECFFFNERDLQIHLALYLQQTQNYDDVDVEYHIPRNFKDDFDKEYCSWETGTLSIDITVRKAEEYVPIELKYKLKEVTSNISRLGEKSKRPIKIITNQGAQDIGRYDFWKDVKRIELLKEHFTNVKGGIALFVTNDQSYQNQPKENVNYYAFRMNEGDTISGNMSWKTESKICESHKEFILNQSYKIEWKSKEVRDPQINKEQTLYYCITKI